MTLDSNFYGISPIEMPKPIALFFNKLDLETKTLAWANTKYLSIHPQANTFFLRYLRRRPGYLDLAVHHSGNSLILAGMPKGEDIRRFLIFLSQHGANTGVRVNHSTGLQCVHYSTHYVARDFPKALESWKALGLPQPTLTITSGDNQAAHYYFLMDYGASQDGLPSVAELQSLLYRYLCGLGCTSLPQQVVPLPGTPSDVHRDTSCPHSMVRMFEQSGEFYHASDLQKLFYAAVKCHPDSLIGAFQKSQFSRRMTKSFDSVIAAWQCICAKHSISSILGVRHLYSSLSAALHYAGSAKAPIDILESHPSISRLNISTSQIDRHPCQLGEANYFWHLADLSGWQPPTKVKSKQSVDGKSRSSNCGNNTEPGLQACKSFAGKFSSELQKLKDFVIDLCADDSIDVMDYMVLVKAYAKTLSYPFDSQYLERLIQQSIRQINGTLEGIGTSRPIDFNPVPWLWEKVIIKNAPNLLVAHPKCGKTSLIIAFIKALLDRKDSFLDYSISNDCYPSILIVGTDQPESDWGRMLKEAGLLTEDDFLVDGIVDLYTATNPLHLDGGGIDKIASYAKANPGLIILIDSLSACTLPLGIDENSASIVLPIQQLINQVSVFHATIIFIHHSSKSAASQSASSASRGSSAIPATMSQIISLERYDHSPNKSETSDNRLVLSTQGRAGMPIKQVIQRTEFGWVNLGSGEETRRRQNRNEIIESLNPRQHAVYLLVEQRWNVDSSKTTVRNVQQELADVFHGADSERSIRSTLEQLRTKKVIDCVLGTKPQEWYPIYA